MQSLLAVLREGPPDDAKREEIAVVERCLQDLRLLQTNFRLEVNELLRRGAPLLSKYSSQLLDQGAEQAHDSQPAPCCFHHRV